MPQQDLHAPPTFIRLSELDFAVVHGVGVRYQAVGVLSNFEVTETENAALRVEYMSLYY